MSTGVCGPDGIPILKRLTAMEPELSIPTPPKATAVESPTLELSESDEEGYDADEDVVEDEGQKEDDGSLQTLLPLLPVLAVVILAYLWGVAYALSPIRTAYPPAF